MVWRIIRPRRCRRPICLCKKEKGGGGKKEKKKKERKREKEKEREETNHSIKFVTCYFDNVNSIDNT